LETRQGLLDGNFVVLRGMMGFLTLNCETDLFYHNRQYVISHLINMPFCRANHIGQ
jgi:hypothetical protein